MIFLEPDEIMALATEVKLLRAIPAWERRRRGIRSTACWSGSPRSPASGRVSWSRCERRIST